MRVIIPTTAKPVELRAVKRRPRVPASYMAVVGDFRPLALSADYHRFVNGPLRLVVPDLPATELSLSDALDCGRSWELPVLLAHLMEAAGRLDAREPLLLWATGMVDADLNPQSADYHIPLKLELSKPIFAEAEASGAQIAMVVPPLQSDEERRLVEAFAAEFGAKLTVAASLAEVTAAFGLETELEAPDAASPQAAASTAAANAPARLADVSPALPQIRPQRGARLAYGLGGVAAAGLAVAGIAFFLSDSSTPLSETGHEPERALVAAADNLAVDGLYAENRAACQEKIYTGEHLVVEPAERVGDGYQLKASEGLCGLRLRNMSEQAQKLFVDTRLTGLAIPGGASILSGGDLSAGEATLLYFARTPSPLSSEAVLRDPTGRESRVSIAIE
ncbi:hypothetical protein [Jiella sonneratiae]|uniref:Uncharacterized protein n=1 Tax=Jiella sonneratiae TaxID=2816856 RepID=A0ABS3J966_9HYPH|nr:hypothetical protein [Jiella sonneratiae]MBO0905468.1 hypothetical protein [Jiella sonneratiae]